MNTLAMLTVASGGISLFSLLILHVLSPEFKPNWRMVSEYALGRHKWALTLFFSFWFICSVLLVLLLWNAVSTVWAKLGLILVLISGAGALMGGMFDVKHKLHGLAFALGIPTLPAGALLVSYHLVNKEAWASHQSSVLLSAHATWISLLLMAASMMWLFSGFKKAGVPMGPNVEPPESVPDGVVAVNGYANRLLILCYIGWLMWMAKTYLAM